MTISIPNRFYLHSIKISNITTESIVIILYAIYVLLHALTSTRLSAIAALNSCQTVFNYVAIGGLFANIFFMNGISFKKMLFVSLSVCLLIIIVLHANSATESTLLVLFIVSGFHLKSKKVFYVYFYIVAGVVLLTVLLCLIGVLPNYVAYDIFTGRKRHYLGFNYASYLSNFFFHLLLVYFYLKNKITVASTCIILAINYLVMKLTDTRAVFYLVIFLVAFAWMEKKMNRCFKLKIVHWGFVAIMPALCAIIIYLSYNYTPKSLFYTELNNLLSTRLQMGHQAITEYGFPLFGTHIEWSVGQFGVDRKTAYFYVDSAYLNGVYTYGFIMVMAVTIGFSYISHRNWKEGRYLNCIIISMLAMHGFTDPQLMVLLYNPFLLSLGYIFSQNHYNAIRQKLLEFFK